MSAPESDSGSRVRVKRKKTKKEKSLSSLPLDSFVASKKFSNSVALAVQSILLEQATGIAVPTTSTPRSRRASVSLDSSAIALPPVPTVTSTTDLQRSLSFESLRRSGETPIAAPLTPTTSDLRRVAARNASPRSDTSVVSSSTSSANVSPRGTSVMSRIGALFNTSPRRAALSPSGSKIFSKDSNQAGICAHFSGSYEFLRPLGEGGMASVYEADYRGMLVAVKVYHSHFYTDGPDEERDKLLAKIIYIGSLPENRRIVPLFAYRFEPATSGGSQLVLVMGLMSTSLSSIVKQRRKSYYGAKKHKTVPFPEHLAIAPFSISEVAHIMMQILEGLEFLHKHGVIHRDLKGENILARRREYETAAEVFDKNSISRTASPSTLSSSSSRVNNDDDGSDEEQSDEAQLAPPKKYLQTSFDICTGEQTTTMEPNVGRCYEYKIADIDDCRIENQSNFLRRSSSLSQSVKKPPPPKHFTLHVGTPNYRAPEMVDKTTTSYSNKVDIWAVGMILYLLLTLEIPYSEKKDQFQIQTALENKETPSVPAGYIQSKEWSGVLQIYNSCVQIDPEKRLSASELLQRVTKLL